VIILKIYFYKWFVLLLLALICPNIWIYSSNIVILIPLLALYLGIGKKEGLIFAVMSSIPTLLYGYIYVVLLLVSYIIYLILYKISTFVFLDDIDCAMVSSFLCVFIMLVEKESETLNLGVFFICLGFSLLSFWLYFVLFLIKDYLFDRIGDKCFDINLCIYQSSMDQCFCGDCYDYFSFMGKKYILFSDGMYVGEDAYNLSSEVLSSIRSGIECGNEIEDVVNTCSKLMVKKYNHESFSTLDLVELLGNKLMFIKRGAENSLLIRNRDVIAVKSNSLPLGIEGKSSVNNFRVKDEDVLILFSDGVKEKYPLFEEMVRDRLYGDNLDKWVKTLVCDKYEDQKDDMSILVIKFVDIS
jgi:hypothetical protein